MANPTSKPAVRRPLPQARSSAPGYEITFPNRKPASFVSAAFSFVKELFGRTGDTVGDAYAAGARKVLNRKEALEDYGAERRHIARSGPASAPAPSETDTRAGN